MKYIYLITKRIFDFIVGLIGTILLVPIIILVKIAYMCTGDFKSIFYTQKRIGYRGKEFRLIKFRSMVPNADEVLKEMLKDKKIKKIWDKDHKLEDDPRVTKVGKFLRKLSLDETPQFINILIGNMSLVGNRPYLIRERKDMGDYYEKIVSIKPGLTGYWQVNGRSDNSFEKRLQLEYYYSFNYGFILDIKIIIKTIKVVLGMEGSK